MVGWSSKSTRHDLRDFFLIWDTVFLLRSLCPLIHFAHYLFFLSQVEKEKRRRDVSSESVLLKHEIRFGQGWSGDIRRSMSFRSFLSCRSASRDLWRTKKRRLDLHRLGNGDSHESRRAALAVVRNASETTGDKEFRGELHQNERLSHHRSIKPDRSIAKTVGTASTLDDLLCSPHRSIEWTRSSGLSLSKCLVEELERPADLRNSSNTFAPVDRENSKSEWTGSPSDCLNSSRIG